MINMSEKVEYKRSGKKLLKVVTVEVNEKRLKRKITRLRNEVRHADQQIIAWTKTRDTLKAEVDSLDRAYNSSPEIVKFD
jgi:uncharacterized coiled-coil DUF342 family protein